MKELPERVGHIAGYIRHALGRGWQVETVTGALETAFIARHTDGRRLICSEGNYRVRIVRDVDWLADDILRQMTARAEDDGVADGAWF